jgi:23S rRNA (cytosine1962-C5)-methyltransferase
VVSFGVPPCVIFEDEHLLVVNKPAGWNTHAPSPFAGEGIYDWLKNREPRWSSLAIIHRLDKETSGILVFGKTPLANKSLTEQFAGRAVHKKYLLLTDRIVKQRQATHKSKITRAGERYVSSPRGEPAETRFTLLQSPIGNRQSAMVEAEPFTGRTHQIRVHAAEQGFPILGDTLYGGTPFHRVCLHAHEISFRHPAANEPVSFTAPIDFMADTHAALRAAIIEPAQTDACRVIHGASDGWPGWYVERLGQFLLSQGEKPLGDEQMEFLKLLVANDTPVGVHASACPGSTLKRELQPPAVYHKILTRRVQRASVAETSPRLVLGKAAPEQFVIRENGVKFELSFNEGYSTGLFLDQRDNRRRFLTGHVAPDFHFGIRNSEFGILNCFAYTCGLSICAALAGAKTTSLDLSKKYLEWGKRNFALNGLDPAAHDFIYGDTFDWLRRFAKKGRQFDVVVLDPPTFSRSKEGTFRAEKDFGKLVAAALPVLKPGGVLFASTNAATSKPEDFLETITSAIRTARRKILKQHYVPQPPDFPITRAEPGYLKTVWLRIA